MREALNDVAACALRLELKIGWKNFFFHILPFSSQILSKTSSQLIDQGVKFIMTNNLNSHSPSTTPGDENSISIDLALSFANLQRHQSDNSVSSISLCSRCEISNDEDDSVGDADSDHDNAALDQHDIDFYKWQIQAQTLAQNKMRAHAQLAKQVDATLKYQQIIQAHTEQQQQLEDNDPSSPALISI